MLPADRRAAGVRRERRQRARVVLVLEAAEREQLVLDDRAAGPHAGVREVRVEALPGVVPTEPGALRVADVQISLRVAVVDRAVNWLVPLRVTVLTPAPMKLPWRTSYGATLTCTCSIASSEIGATPVRSPMPPVVRRGRTSC